ncbi:unnamed protein product [Pleuronectes platessa]|uniref:Uncharacterized protein n=1 Tax=Pleuronectes platessa TaxID=8262 RepID=A0A9N7VMJ0_PLEPL|nr:unnamed protein product [Pleuronectes platessa]
MLSITASKWKYSVKPPLDTQHPADSRAPVAIRYSSPGRSCGTGALLRQPSARPRGRRALTVPSQPPLCPGDGRPRFWTPCGVIAVAPVARPGGMDMFVCSGADHLERRRYSGREGGGSVDQAPGEAYLISKASWS